MAQQLRFEPQGTLGLIPFMMVGPVFVVLIIQRQLQRDRNRSDVK